MTATADRVALGEMNGGSGTGRKRGEGALRCDSEHVQYCGSSCSRARVTLPSACNGLTSIPSSVYRPPIMKAFPRTESGVQEHSSISIEGGDGHR